MTPEAMHKRRIWLLSLWLQTTLGNHRAHLISAEFLDAAEAEKERVWAASTPGTTPPKSPPARRDE